MATKRKTKKPELLVRRGVISKWQIEIFTHGASGRNYQERMGKPNIHACGEWDAGLNGVSAFDLLLTRRPAKELQADNQVGMILSVKTEISGLVDFTEEEFDTALALAMANRSIHLYMTFDQPHYGAGAIRSFLISTDPIE